ncbi:Mammalian ependymin-related protein 1 [Mactra antiquata]
MPLNNIMINCEFIVIIFVVIFTSTTLSGTLPPKCCFPKQYETFIHAISGLQDGDNVAYGNGTVRTAFDGIKQFTFTHEHSLSYSNVFPIPIPQDYIGILDYKADKQWRVYNDLSCDKLDVGLPLYEECIPGNATLISQGTFGPEGKMLMTYLFHDRIYLDPYEVTISVIMSDVFKGECWPVRMTYSSAYVFDSNKNVDITSADIFDFTPGIKDMSIFTPPSVCDQAETKQQDDDSMPPPVGLSETIVAFSSRLRNNRLGGIK